MEINNTVASPPEQIVPERRATLADFIAFVAAFDPARGQQLEGDFAGQLIPPQETPVMGQPIVEQPVVEQPLVETPIFTPPTIVPPTQDPFAQRDVVDSVVGSISRPGSSAEDLSETMLR